MFVFNRFSRLRFKIIIVNYEYFDDEKKNEFTFTHFQKIQIFFVQISFFKNFEFFLYIRTSNWINWQFLKINERNIVDDCTKCNAIVENKKFFNSFFRCKRLIDVDDDVCECCLFKHRNQNYSINEYSIMTSIVQTFTRSRNFFITLNNKFEMRSTTRTFEIK